MYTVENFSLKKKMETSVPEAKTTGVIFDFSLSHLTFNLSEIPVGSYFNVYP